MGWMDGWTDGPALDTVSYTSPSHLSPTAYITKELTFYFKTYRLGRRVGDLHMFQQSEEMLWHIFTLPITLQKIKMDE
jgi:hypothetical protein